ncbi:hypothetical protein GC207_13665 [bacterium]|nr:hypothetical protein [bacterium]
MKIQESKAEFTPCPEYTGRAVCVDVTPLKKQQSQFGERDVFKIVFETELDREDGSRFCAWSRNFTPSVNEKANLRKFLRGWFGRDLTKEELAGFETDSLIGKPAQIVVVHEFKDDQTYANIVACTPHRTGEPLQPCGAYIRVIDRQAEPAPNGAGAPGGGGYRRAQGVAEPTIEHAAVKIHVGRCKGLELRDLAPEQVEALIAHWLPTAKAKAKPLADDRRLMAALDWWLAMQRQPAADGGPVDEDNIPY